MNLKERITALQESIPAGVELVAVSKTHPAEVVREAYDAGLRVFGENRPQEMCAKRETLPGDIRWHMIGHVQTNKVKYIAPFVAMIHSVDSPRLMDMIQKEAARNGRVIDVLMEIYIAAEETKSGWTRGELTAYLAGGGHLRCPNVRIRGLMGIASFTDDMAQVRREFEGLHSFYKEVGARFFAGGENVADGAGASLPGGGDCEVAAPDGAGAGVSGDGAGSAAGTDAPPRPEGNAEPLPVAFDTLSMGMTSDWQLAVECGSNMVRIGSAIFGARDYGI